MMYWQNLTLREKRMIILGVLSSVVLLFYIWLWSPLQQAISNHQQQIISQQNLLNWMQRAASEIKNLQPFNNESNIKESVLVEVENSLAQAKLAHTVKTVQQPNDNQIELYLGNVPFDNLLQWLRKLRHRKGIYVDQLNVSKTSTTGLVNAKLMLSK